MKQKLKELYGKRIFLTGLFKGIDSMRTHVDPPYRSIALNNICDVNNNRLVDHIWVPLYGNHMNMKIPFLSKLSFSCKIIRYEKKYFKKTNGNIKYMSIMEYGVSNIGNLKIISPQT